jgi:malonyl CoA-acyl carrier protein transacylase
MSILGKADPAVLREQLAAIVSEAHSTATAEAAKGRLEPKRGKATIPLPGIDVPFHSSVLRGGVAEFRAYLSKRVGAIKPKTLVGKYIPNLVAKPFELTKEYTELVLEATRGGSTRLAKIVRNWEKDEWDSVEKEQELCRALLIELLAFQFASCVRWIETQDIFFEAPYSFERLVEFGPSPTLVGMATRTHKIKYAGKDQAQGKKRVMLCHSKDQEPLYYSFADMEDDGSADAGPSSQPDNSSAAPVAAPVAAAPVAAPAASSGGGGVAADVPDVPLSAIDTVRCILAQKLKKPVTESEC